MSLAFDENGRPFIILREQEKKKRVKGLEAHKVSFICPCLLIRAFCFVLSDTQAIVLISQIGYERQPWQAEERETLFRPNLLWRGFLWSQNNSRNILTDQFVRSLTLD